MPPNRRACDRCHQQELRCPRHTCVYSMPNPTGRPVSKKATSHRNQSSRSTVSASLDAANLDVANVDPTRDSSMAAIENDLALFTSICNTGNVNPDPHECTAFLADTATATFDTASSFLRDGGCRCQRTWKYLWEGVQVIVRNIQYNSRLTGPSTPVFSL